MARVLALLLVLAFLTAGCADSDDDDGDGSGNGTSTQTGTGGGATATASVSVTGTGAPSNDTHAVVIDDDEYDPEEITIKRGDTVNWTQVGSHPHSVTSDAPGLFDSSPTCSSASSSSCMQQGDSFEHEFDLAPGTYTYHCRVHPTTMTGTITVTN